MTGRKCLILAEAANVRTQMSENGPYNSFTFWPQKSGPQMSDRKSWAANVRYYANAVILCKEIKENGEKACNDSKVESFTHIFNCIWIDGDCSALRMNQYYEYTC
ncbi:hypothetical protein GPALN_010788 [Globodera pallida]|nr:hypothetical protein GPALN_010788 [Globodera pallida]